nr:hypothetical protein BaRGS_000634 [Batillaria attramentaria]
MCRGTLARQQAAEYGDMETGSRGINIIIVVIVFAAVSIIVIVRVVIIIVIIIIIIIIYKLVRLYTQCEAEGGHKVLLVIYCAGPV